MTTVNYGQAIALIALTAVIAMLGLMDLAYYGIMGLPVPVAW